MKFKYLAALLTSLLLSASINASPLHFERAKIELRNNVYFDRNNSDEGTFYCGCHWEWLGRSGGRVDLAGCGYEIRAQEVRAQRIEYDHIVPVWVMGHQRQCWQDGGRRNCKASDPVFNVMEADMHNLTPTVGEINADRSNYSFGMLPSTERQHGSCDFKVDFSNRVAEPRDEVKGMIARIYFYIHDRYDLSMSRQQQQLMMAWDRQWPATKWELERNRRIEKVMGHGNPFVSGERSWTLGHRNTAEGIVSRLPPTLDAATTLQPELGIGPVRGNRRSKVYHLPSGCPSYDQVRPQNQVPFNSEADAVAAGYRKAGNCT